MENQQKSEPGRLGGYAEKLASTEGEEEPLTDFQGGFFFNIFLFIGFGF